NEISFDTDWKFDKAGEEFTFFDILPQKDIPKGLNNNLPMNSKNIHFFKETSEKWISISL
ncbi:MAG: hypothetical protein KAT07_12765, partial [Calditrichia bacterium]|nr:hypothetical protein [Calditrichia bacterium]